MNLFQKSRAKAGQSTVEYILLVTAVIAVMVFFATSKDRGIQAKLTNSYNQVGDAIADKTATLEGSHTSSNVAVSTPVPTGKEVSLPDMPTLPK